MLQIAVKTVIVGLGIMGQCTQEHMLRHEKYAPIALWDSSPDACKQFLNIA